MTAMASETRMRDETVQRPDVLIVASRKAVDSLKLAFSRANNAMSERESAGGSLCEVFEADYGGKSMAAHIAADEARDDLDAIRLAADCCALAAMNFLKCFIDLFPSPEAEPELSKLVTRRMTETEAENIDVMDLMNVARTTLTATLKENMLRERVLSCNRPHPPLHAPTSNHYL